MRRHQDVERPGRKELCRPVQLAADRPLPLAPISAGMALGLQRSAGNIAVQRLMTTKEFRKKTHVSVAVRGRTLQDIERLLDEYHVLRARGAHLKPGPGMDRVQQLLTELRDDATFWHQTHWHDTSRSKNRMDGIVELGWQARDELKAMEETRAAAKEVGLDVGDFKPEENKFLLRMKGSASSVLEKLGTAIGMAIPKPGDSVTAELSVSVPCEPDGVGYVGFRIKAEAARMDNKATNVRFEVAVTGGAQIAGVADIGGELGFFLQAQAANPELVMKLVSYGWYRKFRESPMPREVANLMWGGSLTTVGWKRSENWAANIENEAFSRKKNNERKKKAGEKEDVALSSGVGSAATTNEYVRIGALAGVGMAADVNAASLEASSTVNVGTHYDERSITAGKKGKIGLPQVAGRRGQTAFLGTSYLTVDTSFAASVVPFGGSMSLSLELLTREQKEKDRKLWLPEGYLSGFGSLSGTFPMPPALLPWLAVRIKQLAPKLNAGVASLGAKAAKDKRTKNQLGQNFVGGAGDTLLPALAALNPADMGAAQLLSAASGAVGMPVTVTLQLGTGYQFGAGGSGWTFDIQVSQEAGVDIAAPFSGLTLKKGSRLLRVIFSEGRWKPTID